MSRMKTLKFRANMVTIEAEPITMRDALLLIARARQDEANRPTSAKLTKCHDGVWRYLPKAERPQWNATFTAAP